MTKKDTTIRNIIALLAIILLGALAVYCLIPSLSPTNPGTNQETSSENVPKKHNTKPHAALISVCTVANVAWQDKIRRMLFRFECTILAFTIWAAMLTLVEWIDVEFYSRYEPRLDGYWEVGLLILLGLGLLCDRWLRSYNKQWLYYIVIGEVNILRVLCGLIALGWLKILTSIAMAKEW